MQFEIKRYYLLTQKLNLTVTTYLTWSWSFFWNSNTYGQLSHDLCYIQSLLVDMSFTIFSFVINCYRGLNK